MEERFTDNNLPPVLQTAFSENEVYSSAGGKIPLDSNVSLEESLCLYTAVRNLKPTVSAEVGFAKGISTLSILQGLEDNSWGSHHVIDPFQKNYGYAGVEMVNRSGLASRLSFHETFPENVIPNLPNIQFAFIDASHLYDLSLMEFCLLDRKLEIGGVIGFHDMWMASLQKVLRYILNNRPYRIHALSQNSEAMNSSNLKTMLKRQVSTIVTKIPNSRRIFSPELISPWSVMGISNLVLLEKIGEDHRDWKFHERF